MTRYSASRGIVYSAPPGPEEGRTVDTTAEIETDAEADTDRASADD